MAANSQSAEILRALLLSEPARVWDWVQGVWSGEQEFNADFNWWLGLAQGAVHHTFPEDSALDFDWARVAAAIYEFLARTSPSSSRHSFLFDLMLFKARLISDVVNLTGKTADQLATENPLLDTSEIITWFFTELTLSREEALARVQLGLKKLWDSHPDDVVELRRIKNRLRVISMLKERGKVELSGELLEWLKIRDQLP